LRYAVQSKTSILVTGTYEEFNTLQGHMYDEGNKFGAMQVRLLINGGKLDLDFDDPKHMILMLHRHDLFDVE